MTIIEVINTDLAIERVRAYLLDLQNQICDMLTQEDGVEHFREDEWQHASGGGGYTRILNQGAVIEKAGVNFSHVHGKQLPPSATQKRPHFDKSALEFQALGVSTVVHPLNPYAPTTHANLRFIVVQDGSGAPAQWWFGGGFDLTPYYGFKEDCTHWHHMAKVACTPFGKDVYPSFKKWCDEYFYLKHRQEPRGIGGLFFDDLNNLADSRWNFENTFRFMQSVGEHFIKAYQPILHQRKALAYGDHERQFQCYRRGRYVEFNLLYDRGTLFGLQSGGRTESILMSLPPTVNWVYDWQPRPGSKEAELYEIYLRPKNW